MDFSVWLVSSRPQKEEEEEGQKERERERESVAMWRGKAFNSLGPLRQKLPEESRHTEI